VNTKEPKVSLITLEEQLSKVSCKKIVTSLNHMEYSKVTHKSKKISLNLSKKSQLRTTKFTNHPLHPCL